LVGNGVFIAVAPDGATDGTMSIFTGDVEEVLDPVDGGR